jgi:putative restriction endonuclease
MNSERVARYGELWEREELILAFELYCRIPFQKTKATNPDVQKLSSLLGRTPASVARKLGNLGAFDPILQSSKITGLVHTSKLDREIWDEFHDNWNELVWQANKLRQQIGQINAETITLKQPKGPSEIFRLTKQRVHQAFFRDAVLSSYNSTCCITGLTINECLIASHIVPWRVTEEYRADPTNGLCLSSTFDRLFDSGLLTITDDYRVRMSKELMRTNNPITKKIICGYDGKPLIKPNRFMPSVERLRWHRFNVFKE